MSAVTLTGWEDEDANLGVLALASHLEDYQMAFMVNKLFNTKFKNFVKTTQFQKKGTAYEYSVYKSEETKTTPLLYLVDNQSILAYDNHLNNSLFDSLSFYQTPLIASLKKWHYFMLSEDLNWLTKINATTKNQHILYTLSVDILMLNKNEQTVLHSLTYDE